MSKNIESKSQATNRYNRPWSVVDNEELALLKKIERIMRQISKHKHVSTDMELALQRLDEIRK